MADDSESRRVERNAWRLMTYSPPGIKARDSRLPDVHLRYPRPRKRQGARRFPIYVCLSARRAARTRSTLRAAPPRRRSHRALTALDAARPDTCRFARGFRTHYFFPCTTVLATFAWFLAIIFQAIALDNALSESATDPSACSGSRSSSKHFATSAWSSLLRSPPCACSLWRRRDGLRGAGRGGGALPEPRVARAARARRLPRLRDRPQCPSSHSSALRARLPRPKRRQSLVTLGYDVVGGIARRTPISHWSRHHPGVVRLYIRERQCCLSALAASHRRIYASALTLTLAYHRRLAGVAKSQVNNLLLDTPTFGSSAVSAWLNTRLTPSQSASNTAAGRARSTASRMAPPRPRWTPSSRRPSATRSPASRSSSFSRTTTTSTRMRLADMLALHAPPSSLLCAAGSESRVRRRAITFIVEAPVVRLAHHRLFVPGGLAPDANLIPDGAARQCNDAQPRALGVELQPKERRRGYGSGGLERQQARRRERRRRVAAAKAAGSGGGGWRDRVAGAAAGGGSGGLVTVSRYTSL
ncbi:hypothetical protein GGX14DRAFT_396267 [Mycena pura]|uniref:Uncharacterized protein n=1 Tax=Mycena pura TaxID=153505 RepID=A0AAD6YBG7_9AGAR|nr:hypothetical protein GGX14DRAFT_396267 [Mycena pura]